MADAQYYGRLTAPWCTVALQVSAAHNHRTVATGSQCSGKLVVLSGVLRNNRGRRQAARLSWATCDII